MHPSCQIVRYLHQTPENREIGEKWGKTQFFPKLLTLTLKTLDPPVRNSWHLQTGGSRVMEPSVKSFRRKCQVFQKRMRYAWKGRDIRCGCFVRTFWLGYKILPPVHPHLQCGCCERRVCNAHSIIKPHFKCLYSDIRVARIWGWSEISDHSIFPIHQSGHQKARSFFVPNKCS